MSNATSEQPRGGRGAGAARGSGRPPFAHLAPAVAIAGGFGVAALAWAVVGEPLPGGRWLAVHLFTLGVLSTLIVAMTDHFTRTLTRSSGDGRNGWRLGLLALGTLGVTVGLPTGWLAPFAIGATLTLVAVGWLYVALRRMRKGALGDRFHYVVRAYERATGAFLHGALLGALLGAGVVGGDWYAAVRLAHLAVMILGWGGLVLLATLVFFGPTLLRAQMHPRAAALAVPALRHGATALSVAFVALILTGAGGPVGLAFRAVAALGLLGYAVAAGAVCLPVLAAARRAVPSPHGRMIAACSLWFPSVALAAAVAVAADEQRLLDALGLALLVGVLAQAIIASLSYLLPMVVAGGPHARSVARERLDRLGALRPVALNLGVVLVVAATALRPLLAVDLSAVAAAGWALLAATVAVTVAFAADAARCARLARTG